MLLRFCVECDGRGKSSLHARESDACSGSENGNAIRVVNACRLLAVAALGIVKGKSAAEPDVVGLREVVGAILEVLPVQGSKALHDEIKVLLKVAQPAPTRPKISRGLSAAPVVSRAIPRCELLAFAFDIPNCVYCLTLRVAGYSSQHLQRACRPISAQTRHDKDL